MPSLPLPPARTASRSCATSTATNWRGWAGSVRALTWACNWSRHCTTIRVSGASFWAGTACSHGATLRTGVTSTRWKSLRKPPFTCRKTTAGGGRFSAVQHWRVCPRKPVCTRPPNSCRCCAAWHPEKTGWSGIFQTMDGYWNSSTAMIYHGWRSREPVAPTIFCAPKSVRWCWKPRPIPIWPRQKPNRKYKPNLKRIELITKPITTVAGTPTARPCATPIRW